MIGELKVASLMQVPAATEQPFDPELTEELLIEAARIVTGSSRDGLTLRVMGGAAVALHAAGGTELFRLTGRQIADLDFVCSSRNRRGLQAFMSEAGYEPNATFNAYNGKTRHLYHRREGAHRWQVDVFFDQVRMCHLVDYRDRLDQDRPTVPLAELLLQKLQIVDLNRKDVVDVAALLSEHALADDDADHINRTVLAAILGDDWGFYRTVTGNLARLAELFRRDQLGVSVAGVVPERLDELSRLAEEAPKNRRWRLRARVGERVRWYQVVEEVVR